MKCFFFGMFLAVSLFGFVGCSDYSNSSEDLREQCLKEPNLPICQENRDNDDMDENTDNPSIDEEL